MSGPRDVRPRLLRWVLALLPGLFAGALLVYNTASAKAGTDLSHVAPAGWRYWRDLGFALSSYLGSLPPARPLSPAEFETLRRQVIAETEASHIRPREFWRRIRPVPLASGTRVPLQTFDDPGQALLLAAAFHILDGIYPFLLLWLRCLWSLPLLVWAAWEFRDAGSPWAGAIFVTAFASSAYAVDFLTLGYSSAGWYLPALLLLFPLSVYALLGRCRAVGLFLLRFALAGLCFGALALCRSGCLLLLPGFFLALVLGLRRVFQESPLHLRARTLVALLALALFLGPYALLRQPQKHDFWPTIWEGLGDFDRTKGYAWSDAEAKRFLRREGVSGLANVEDGLWGSAQSEATFRRKVQNDILHDPSWYAAILGHRLWATLSQQKLRPWGSRDRVSMVASTHPSEGMMDAYYGLTASVDFFALGPFGFGIPVGLLVAPTLALGALGLLEGALALSKTRRTRLKLGVLSCPALAALGAPLWVSTASGPETQAFALVYFLGAGFLFEEVLERVRRRVAPSKDGTEELNFSKA